MMGIGLTSGTFIFSLINFLVLMVALVYFLTVLSKGFSSNAVKKSAMICRKPKNPRKPGIKNNMRPSLRWKKRLRKQLQ